MKTILIAGGAGLLVLILQNANRIENADLKVSNEYKTVVKTPKHSVFEQK